MSRILAMIRTGRAHGVDDATLLAIIEAGEIAAPARSSNAERQARYRANQSERNADNVTSNVTDNVTTETPSPDKEKRTKKEINPTPAHAHTREATPAEIYGDEIRGVFARASTACPDLNPSIAWRNAGWPIEIVCETIRAKLAAAGTRRISTLNFFTPAIADALASANAPVPVGQARAGPSPPRNNTASLGDAFDTVMDAIERKKQNGQEPNRPDYLELTAIPHSGEA